MRSVHASSYCKTSSETNSRMDREDPLERLGLTTTIKNTAIANLIASLYEVLALYGQ